MNDALTIIRYVAQFRYLNGKIDQAMFSSRGEAIEWQKGLYDTYCLDIENEHPVTFSDYFKLFPEILKVRKHVIEIPYSPVPSNY